jgi:hypothetical protein
MRRASDWRRLHADQLRTAEPDLRPCRQRLRWPDRLRLLRGGPIMWRWRCGRTMRHAPGGCLYAADVPTAEYRLRPGGRRLRPGDRLRQLSDRTSLWRRWLAGQMRCTRSRRVHPADLPAAEHRLRAGRRRMRQLSRLRHVPAPTDVRRRRRPRAMRRHVRLPPVDLPAAEHRLRAGGRRMRRPTPVRDVLRAANVRRWRRSGSVRRQRFVRAANVPEPEHPVRTGGRRMWRSTAVRDVLRAANVRGRRCSGTVWRRNDVSEDGA